MYQPDRSRIASGLLIKYGFSGRRLGQGTLSFPADAINRRPHSKSTPQHKHGPEKPIPEERRCQAPGHGGIKPVLDRGELAVLDLWRYVVPG